MAVEDAHEDRDAPAGLLAEAEFLRRDADATTGGDAAVGGADDEIGVDRRHALRIAEEIGAPGGEDQPDPEDRLPEPAEEQRDEDEDRR